MTDLLEKAIEAARKLPSPRQDEIARLMLDMADDGSPQPIPAEHRAAVLEGLRQARNGQFASDEEVEKALLSFRR